jgi:hypothetical protein
LSVDEKICVAEPDRVAGRASCPNLSYRRHEDGAAMLADVLWTMGHHIQVAHDAPAALKAAQSFSSHVAFLDIGLR